MAEVLITDRAYLDLEEIREYIALRSKDAAKLVLREIQRRAESTADFPLSGRARPELHVAIRSFPVGNYIVYYVPHSEGIEIRRILHAARDVDETDF